MKLLQKSLLNFSVALLLGTQFSIVLAANNPASDDPCLDAARQALQRLASHVSQSPTSHYEIKAVYPSFSSTEVDSIRDEFASNEKFVSDLEDIMKGSASEATRKEYERIFTEDIAKAKFARKVLSGSGLRENELVMVFNNALLKRINTALGFQNANDKIAALRAIVLKYLDAKTAEQLFLTDAKSVQAITTMSLTDLQKALDQINIDFFELLKDDPRVLQEFGSLDEFRKATHRGLGIGLGNNHLEASVAAKIAVLDHLPGNVERTRVIRFDAEIYSEVMNHATELFQKFPSSLKIGNHLSQDLFLALRKGDRTTVNRILSTVTSSANEQSNLEHLLNDYAAAINTMDYLEPRIMSQSTLDRASRLLESKDMPGLAKLIWNEDPRREYAIFQVIDPAKTKLTLALDVINMGGRNFDAMETSLPEMKALLDDPRTKLPPTSEEYKAWKKEVDEKIQNSLEPVNQQLDHLILKPIREELNAMGIKDSEFVLVRKGEDIWVEINKSGLDDQTVLNRVIQSTGHQVRGSSYVPTARDSGLTVFATFDRNTNVIKYFEKKGIYGVRVRIQNQNQVVIEFPSFVPREQAMKYLEELKTKKAFDSLSPASPISSFRTPLRHFYLAQASVN